MLNEQSIELVKEPQPIIEQVEKKFLIKEESFQWYWPWTYLICFSSISPLLIAWKMSTNTYNSIVYFSIGFVLSLIVFFMGLKTRIKIPAKYQIEVSMVSKYKYYCQFCYQYIGKFEKISEEMKCSRCGSNRISNIDPLKENQLVKNRVAAQSFPKNEIILGEFQTNQSKEFGESEYIKSS